MVSNAPVFDIGDGVIRVLLLARREDGSTSFQLTIATRTVLPNVSFPVLSNFDQYRKFVETFTFSG